MKQRFEFGQSQDLEKVLNGRDPDQMFTYGG